MTLGSLSVLTRQAPTACLTSRQGLSKRVIPSQVARATLAVLSQVAEGSRPQRCNLYLLVSRRLLLPSCYLPRYLLRYLLSYILTGHATFCYLLPENTPRVRSTGVYGGAQSVPYGGRGAPRR